MEKEFRRKDDDRWKLVSFEFVSLMIVLLGQTGGMVWWASSVEHRLTTMEHTQNTQTDGKIRDIRIDRLEEMAAAQNDIHNTQNLKMENMNALITEVVTNTAVMKKQFEFFMGDNGKQR